MGNIHSNLLKIYLVYPPQSRDSFCAHIIILVARVIFVTLVTHFKAKYINIYALFTERPREMFAIAFSRLKSVQKYVRLACNNKL